MIDRIAKAFATRPALVTYVMGGDPDLRTSQAMALACVEGGADLLEIGMPFSDPIADGPTLQGAAERALKAGTTVQGCLDLVRSLRKVTQIPIALMGYLNPVLSYGEEPFLKGCQEVGVDGLIIPDLPPEEADRLCAAARPRGVAVVFLLAPTSTDARRTAVLARASGFVYFVSVTGVTGARAQLPADLGGQLDRLRKQSPVPVVVGFGVGDPEQAGALGQHADGVVVGSAIVSRIAQGGPLRARADRVRKFVRSLKNGLERASPPSSRRTSP